MIVTNHKERIGMADAAGRHGHSGAERQGQRIAVIGSGIAGLSAAWLLSRRHLVTLYESEARPGGHTNTVDVAAGGASHRVDTGFIVYNEATYPNLAALFAHLGVATRPSEMSFAVSLDGGRLEYEGTNLRRLFAQKRNLLRPRFWRMLRDILRFYKEAPALARDLPAALTLGELLDRRGYGTAFQQEHLLPMAGAIWSGSAASLRDYPAAHFIRFCDNHGLLQVADRPVWRTVQGGSAEYLRHMLPSVQERLIGVGAVAVRRDIGAVEVRDSAGGARSFDHAVLACHADQALQLLEDPTEREADLLGAFGYVRNRAVLHTDPSFMPLRRSAWASWNYLGARGRLESLHVTYWMNRLQGLPGAPDLFVTLNPAQEPSGILHQDLYQHPVFNARAMAAQERLWDLQGDLRTWFCGAYFGAGFHEDGLQSGLAVAEQLGGARRPWTVANESGRIHLPPAAPAARAMAA
jgi:hypothetical protein